MLLISSLLAKIFAQSALTISVLFPRYGSSSRSQPCGLSASSAFSASSALHHGKAQVLLPFHSPFGLLFFAFLRVSAVKSFLRSFGCGFAALWGSQSWLPPAFSRRLLGARDLSQPE
jgi:hypothetical protein